MYILYIFSQWHRKCLSRRALARVYPKQEYRKYEYNKKFCTFFASGFEIENVEGVSVCLCVCVDA